MSRFNSPQWAIQISQPLAKDVAASLSAPRMARHDQSGSDPELALANHAHNLLLCEALYPTLHMLEVVVRNRVHDVLTARFGRPDWYSMAWLSDADYKMVTEAENKLTQHNKALTPDNVIAALSFGFWCAIVNKRYESPTGLWPNLVPKVIPYAPKPLRSRKSLHSHMEAARYLRNRVFHHEPIRHLPNLRQRYLDLLTLLKMFSPNVRQHTATLCRFSSVLQAQPQLAPPPANVLTAPAAVEKA